jgi:uncharacterized spore protein YtfJ
VTKLGPVRVRTVRGDPYSADGRKLIPVVRIASFGRARATVGRHRISGRGGGFVWVRPVAMLEETPEGERPITITDGTASAVRRLLGVALAITLLCAIIRWLAGRLHRSRPAG